LSNTNKAALPDVCIVCYALFCLWLGIDVPNLTWKCFLRWNHKFGCGDWYSAGPSLRQKSLVRTVVCRYA
jgi:hypothetical protein